MKGHNWTFYYLLSAKQKANYLTDISSFLTTIVIRQYCVCIDLSVMMTLCDPKDYSPPGYSVYAILHARILEWIDITFPKIVLGLWNSAASKLL